MPTPHGIAPRLVTPSAAVTVSALMPTPSRTLPPPLIAAAGWVLPGLGHLLLGQRLRAATVGVMILALFVLGLLIGGVRVLEVPGYTADGRPIVVTPRGLSAVRGAEGPWVMRSHPISELRQKPWSIAQVLIGPVGLAGMAWSVWASDPSNGALGEAPAAQSHARVNEIGVLYTAVAGMLNLLAIIDAAHRAAGPQAAK